MNQSFGPLTGNHLHTLILGTMPGQRSLQSQQYYAHPRNALWPILCSIVRDGEPDYQVHTELSYEQRCSLITQAGFGLWDVLASCERQGSLDSNIIKSTEIPNDINGLANKHPELRKIVCNGRTAEALFKRHVQPTLSKTRNTTQSTTLRAVNSKTALSVVCVPSSSPAMASLDLAAKYKQWRWALKAE